MEDIIKECIDENFGNARNAVETIQDYFGEDNVDIEYPTKKILYDTHDYKFRSIIGNYISVHRENELMRVSFRELHTMVDPELYTSQRENHFLDALWAFGDKVLFKAVVNKFLKDNPVSVIVRFPIVTVTNEYNKSIVIKDLFVKLHISWEGTLTYGPVMLRTTFTREEWDADYAHSHLPGISQHWEHPCLGRGPLQRTVTTLSYRTDNEEIWGLFCYELDKYVKVESIAGGPYRRIESVGVEGSVINNIGLYLSKPYIQSTQLKESIKEFIMNEDIPISYHDGGYNFGISLNELWLRISDYYIKQENKKSFSPTQEDVVAKKLRSTLMEALASGGKFYRKTIRRNQAAYPTQNPVLKFKGQDIYVKIEESAGTRTSNTVYLINNSIISSVLNRILAAINYNYGKETDNQSEGNE